MNKQTAVSFLDIQIIHKINFPKVDVIVLYGHPKKDLPASNSNLIILQNKAGLKQFSEQVQTPFTLVNYSNQSMDFLESHAFLSGIIDFSKIKKSNYTPYLFINNPDGSIRWFFPKTNQRPVFLDLYNGSGWKSTLFVTASKFLSKLKNISILCNGQFSIYHKNNHFIGSSFPAVTYDDLAVFTGTIGENRKAIISLSQKGQGTQFIKIPLTRAASDLVKNEFNQLSSLTKFTYQTTIIPEVQQKGSQIMVSNISPKIKNKNQNWSEVHWDSLEELYQNSHKLKPLNTTPFWQTILDGIDFLDKPFTINNGLPKEKIHSLKTKIKDIFNNIDPTSLLPLGIGHGDFTPWNMYVGENQLHVYDWEMSQPDFPLFFDFFHYFFQKGILVNKDDYAAISNQIQEQLKSKKAEQISSTYSINQAKHLELYLLYILCYYLPKYISQPKLHDQVHWLTSTWLQALQSINQESKTPLNFSHF